MSHVAIGGGVNAGNIKRCLEILKDGGYAGAVSLECDAEGGPLLEESIRWVRETLDILDYPHDIEVSADA
jgi:sugar phosphate isomerase/epimerase